MQPTTLTALFIFFLSFDVLVRMWLARRQIRHVQHHRASVPAAFAEQISLASHQRAADYTVARTRLRILEGLFDAVILLLLTLGGGLALIHQLVASVIQSNLWQQVALIAVVVGLLALIHVPFTLYRQFYLEARFGFNRMTRGLFVSDMAKGILISALLGLPIITLIIWLMEFAGTLWWLWAWGSWVAFNVLVMLIFPTWIAPLFNRFTPLDDSRVKARIEALAKRCDFAIQGLFVMDGSKRSAHGNAYFTGFGRSRRIVFFDTLLAKLTPAEIEAVLAHELGHFKHRHIAKRLVVSFVSSLLLFALLGWLYTQSVFYEGLGAPLVQGQGHSGLALLLFFLVLPVFTFPLTPIMSRLSRKDEFEADRFAAAQSDSSDLIAALVKLFDDNAATLTPDPLHSAFYDSHPPAAVRIERLACA
jgi:STE24 endopeptidase